MIEELLQRAVQAKPAIAGCTTEEKNTLLTAAADALVQRAGEILAENEKDIAAAKEKGMHPGLLDRLTLTQGRIGQMADGIRQVADLEDPVGEISDETVRPNGLVISRVRVPLGVVGIIYEARPNVTADAFALCFKTGNAVVLKGGSDAISSNKAIVKVIRDVLPEALKDALLLIESTDRKSTEELMKARGFVDVLIPRGSAGLISTVVENSTVPVIETGAGNCHIFVDESADFAMALDIIENAKTQRIGVCNACESLVVHSAAADSFLPLLAERLGGSGGKHRVQLRGDERACAAAPAENMTPAAPDDWGREYLDYILSVKVVDSVDEAIAHINRYNTKHSEAIITQNEGNADRFLKEIDAAAVYVNASTRFTDGFEFGFGAEIGISTQKLHARGPMGLPALTCQKYIIRGNGQVRK